MDLRVRNGRERNSKQLWFPAGTRKACNFFQNSNTHRHANRQVSGALVGHRGVSRHHWWRGPREPPPSEPSLYSRTVVTLFVDGISNAITLPEIRKLFEFEGRVADVYISGKKRKNKEDNFGFVRFYHERDAMSAIQNLNGATLHGCKLTVMVAKYKKGGKPVKNQRQTRPKQKLIQNPALRDHRTYSDVLTGRRSVSPPVNRENGAEPRTQMQNKIQEHMMNRLEKEVEETGGEKSKEEESSPVAQRCQSNKTKKKDNSITTVQIEINQAMESKLKLAAVVVFETAMDPKKVVSMISGTSINLSYLSSISPSKMVLFFERETDLEFALDTNSPLRRLFHDVRKWTNKEDIDERLTWIVCCGLHPLCWSLENLEKIGGLWGKIIHVDHNFYGVNSLTIARMLVQTKQKVKIEESICVEWGSNSSVINVREIGMSMDKAEYELLRESLEQEENGISGEEEDAGSKDGRKETGPVQGMTVIEEEHESGQNDDVAAQVNEELPRLKETQNKDDGEYTNRNYGEKQGVNNVHHSDPVTTSILDSSQNNIEVLKFDPMAAAEYAISMLSNQQQNGKACSEICESSTIRSEKRNKRLRGRPRKTRCSQPEPLFVESTPSKTSNEAVETWDMAKQLGIKSTDEMKTISCLRKSKRIQNMEETSPVLVR
ncbi:unnamed protein product [Amaranthus hypochondriacus]